MIVSFFCIVVADFSVDGSLLIPMVVCYMYVLSMRNSFCVAILHFSHTQPRMEVSIAILIATKMHHFHRQKMIT